MKRILAWIRYKWKVYSFSTTRRLIAKWEYLSDSYMTRLAVKEKRFELLFRTHEQLKTETEVELENVRRINEQAQTAMEALRNENEVLSEIIIPNLTAACQLGLERWKADTAVQARRQVGSPSTREVL